MDNHSWEIDVPLDPIIGINLHDDFSRDYCTSTGILQQERISGPDNQDSSAFSGSESHNPAFYPGTDIYRQDDFASTGFMQQDELHNTSSQDRSIFTGNEPHFDRFYQNESYDAYCDFQQDHSIPSATFQHTSFHKAFNQYRSTLASSPFDPSSLALYQNESSTFHQHGFDSASIIQQQEHHNTFDSHDLMFTGSLFTPGVVYQELARNVFHQGNSAHVDIEQQHEMNVIVDPRSVTYTRVFQQSGQHNFSDQLRPGGFVNTNDLQVTLIESSLEDHAALIEPQTATAGITGDTVGKNRSIGTFSEEEWTAKKDIIERIWLKEKHTMPELIYEMAEIHNFSAS